MDDIAKVLILEKNCAQLIALTVWLQQFPELDVVGSMSVTELKQSIDKNLTLEYDLIIYGLEIGNSEEVPLELAMSLSLVRKVKSKAYAPAVILLTNCLNEGQTNNTTTQMSHQLLRESDAQLLMTDSLKDCYREITRLLSYKYANKTPAIKAG